MGVAVSPARTGAVNAMARSQLHVEKVAVGLFVGEGFWVVIST